jgi:hypothetical protein
VLLPLLLLLLQVSIVQFSNDTRVEVPLAPWEKDAFEAGIKNMVRLQHQQYKTYACGRMRIGSWVAASSLISSKAPQQLSGRTPANSKQIHTISHAAS